MSLEAESSGYAKIKIMKVLIALASILMLLVCLPLLHGFFVFLYIEKLATIPTAKSFFYLFTVPAWVLVILIFVTETYRRRVLQSKSRLGNTMLLGLFGMIAPGVGLALSPVAADIELEAFAGIAVLGFFVGLVGAVLFNFATGWINKESGA